MNCAEFQRAFLDGGAGRDEHLAACPACRAWQAAALRLAEGLRLLPRPGPPAGLADRIVALVLEDRRRRARLRRRLVAASALAASLVAAALAGYAYWNRTAPAQPGPIEQAPPVVRREENPAPKGGDPERRPLRSISRKTLKAAQAAVAVGLAVEPPDDRAARAPGGASLRESVAEVGSLVAAWTWRTADQTVEGGRLLLPPMGLTELELPEPLGPEARPLREAGQGVSAGLGPVTTSARRAIDLFLREVPAPPPDGKEG